MQGPKSKTDQFVCLPCRMRSNAWKLICRSCSLVRSEVIEEMLALITSEPPEESDEKTRFKYANIACELLTSDIVAINDALVSKEAVLNKLYNFVNTDNPLNPLLASFYSKTMGLLFSKRTDLMFEFLKTKEDFVTLLLNHLDTSAIMDLLLKLVTNVDNIELRTVVVQVGSNKFDPNDKYS